MRKAMAARLAAARLPSDQPINANDSSVDNSASTSIQTNATPDNATQVPVSEAISSHPRQPWEHVDEILQTLKTTYPLLILSLETMVDQIQHKFKPTVEEDVYRHVSLLLSDAVQVW